MHYCLEIIMPPVSDVEEAVRQILNPFKEGEEDEDGNLTKYSFWDWYVIGGRWSGEKLIQTLDEKQLEKFYFTLVEKGITVSSFTSGKQEIAPASQTPIIDSLWREYFPEGGDVCPLFRHYNDPYKDNVNYPDVMKFSEVSKDLVASRVIIAGLHWNDKYVLEAKTMVEDSVYNGVNWVDTTWDGTLNKAIKIHNKRYETTLPEYKAEYVIGDDWLVVTVDYHA